VKPSTHPAASKPEVAPAAAPAPTGDADLDARRAANKAKRDAAMKALAEELKTTAGSLGTPTPKAVASMLTVIQSYADDGITEFRRVWRQINREYAALMKSIPPRLFEMAWKMETGQTERVADIVEEEGVTDGEDGTLASGEEGTTGPDRPGSDRPADEDVAHGEGPGPEGETKPGPGEGTGEGGIVSGSDGGRGANPALKPPFYRITDDDEIGTGTVQERVKRNIAAIRVVKEIEAEGRTATPDEQRILVRYVGWGGLSRIFEYWKHSGDIQYWSNQHGILQELLTKEEFDRASNSTQNAHYTSPTVIRAMWDAIHRLGVRNGSALEPSSGIGHFIGLAPDQFRAMQWATVEKDEMTARIASSIRARTGRQWASKTRSYQKIISRSRSAMCRSAASRSRIGCGRARCSSGSASTTISSAKRSTRSHRAAWWRSSRVRARSIPATTRRCASISARAQTSSARFVCRIPRFSPTPTRKSPPTSSSSVSGTQAPRCSTLRRGSRHAACNCRTTTTS
jgi:hypothetical protein